MCLLLLLLLARLQPVSFSGPFWAPFGASSQAQSVDVKPSRTQGLRALGKLLGHRKRPPLCFSDTNYLKPQMDEYGWWESMCDYLYVTKTEA